MYSDSILQLLQHSKKPIKCRDIAIQLGCRDYHVRCAIAHLRRQGIRIVGSRNGYYLPLSDGASTTTHTHHSSGPYRVIVCDRDNTILKDVEFQDNLHDVAKIYIRVKLVNGGNIRL